MKIVYYSGRTNNTHRFVEKLQRDDTLRLTKEQVIVEDDYLLIVPTYGNGLEKKLLPFPVRQFLQNPENRKHLKGIVGTGNMNFANAYCAGAKQIAARTGVPVLHQLELMGMPSDVEAVTQILDSLENTDN